MLRLDGISFWAQLISTIVLDDTGAPVCRSVVTDITDRKQMEETLRESEKKYRLLFESSGEAVFVSDENGRILAVNTEACEWLTYTHFELMSMTIIQIISSKEILHMQDRILQLMDQGSLTFETVYQRKDHSLIPTEVNARRIAWDGQTVLISICRDISNRKLTEYELEQHRNHLEDLVQYRTKELLESEKRYREIIDSITDYVYQVKIDEDKNTTTTYTESCCTVTGYQPYEFMNDPYLWLNMVFKEDRSKVNNFIKSIIMEQTDLKKYVEHRIIHKNGSIRWIRNTIVIHKNADGELSGYDGIISDITDIKNAEDEIKRLNLNIINLQEEERQRVAKDLHDSVGQTILAAKINIDAYKQNPQRFANSLDAGLDFLVKASQELREIYMDLYPTILNDLGLEMAIRWLVDNTMESAGIISNIDIKLQDKLPHNLEVNLYRIIQELLSNILKHSYADTIDLTLSSDERKLNLIVKDNGIGIKTEVKGLIASGCGLANIKNRVSHLNGVVSINMEKLYGTTVSVTIEL